MRERTKKFAIGTIFAAAAGYVTGILTAPKSGKETRKDIKETAEKAKSEAEAKLKQAHQELSDLLATAKKNTEHLRGSVKEQAAKTVETATAAKAKAQNVLSSVKSTSKDDKELKKAVKEVNDAIGHLKKYLSQYGKAAKDSLKK